MLTAALFGRTESLHYAFPPSIRADLREMVNLSEIELNIDNYRDHKDLLGRLDIIIGTWDLPRFSPEFLQDTKRLKAVFYAAGTIKSFATTEAFLRGITFSSAWTANAIPVSEYTLGVILLSL